MAEPLAEPTGGPEALSLLQLLDPAVHADPYPFYARLREEAPVHWDPFLHCWVVTRYADVQAVLHHFSADRTPTAAAMQALGLPHIGPVAQMMSRQMLFLDGAAHGRLRQLCADAFTPRRIEGLRQTVVDVAEALIDAVADAGEMDLIFDFAEPFPAMVTAGLLGVPLADHRKLKDWSADFAGMLGNFQHNPEKIAGVLRTVDAMTGYFTARLREQEQNPGTGLLGSLARAEVDGVRLSEEEIIANVVVTMVGGQETTTNLLGNGMLTLLRQPRRLAELRDRPYLMETAVEELLRFETPSQHTARITPSDIVLGDRTLPKGTAVMAVMAAANRDPRQFTDPDILDLSRTPNRHLAFGWGPHFCFGAALARIEAQTAFRILLRRLKDIRLTTDRLAWRDNSGLRGLTALPIAFRATP